MAVIFDMDGVIADTQKIHSRIESELLSEFGIRVSPEEITRRFSGVALRDQFKTLFSEVGRDSPYTEELSDEKYRRLYLCAKEYRGIEGTIDRIERLFELGVSLAVASASKPEFIEFVLSMLKIRDRFLAVTSSREVRNGKPAPDVFLLAARKLGAQPERCIVIEDGVSGMIGARKAGMLCVALAQDQQEYPAVIIVKDLREIPINWFCR